MTGFLGLEEIDDLETRGTDTLKYTEIKPINAHQQKAKKLTKSAPKLKQDVEESPQEITDNVAANDGALMERPMEPSIDSSAWDEYDLSHTTLKNLGSLKFTRPTSIQSMVMKHIMNGEDVIGKARTGSGKTLAFGIPIVESLLLRRKGPGGIAALVIVPTRELALQIVKHLEALCANTLLRITSITGGLSIEKQERLLGKSPDIVVATPGRLWEIMASHSSRFKAMTHLVLDEADRLLEHGHFAELTKILDTLRSLSDYQTLVFSATFDANLQSKLKSEKRGHMSNVTGQNSSLENLLHKVNFRGQPRFLDADPEMRVSTSVTQCIIQVTPLEKDFILVYLLVRFPTKTLVFTNSIGDVHRLTNLLTNLGLPARGLHSNKQQSSRHKILEQFRSTPNSILVATDVAARGLDVDSVDLVVHYHLPRTTDLYIHRSGRTARGSESGVSIVICSSSEVGSLHKMIRTIDGGELRDFPVNQTQVTQLRTRVKLSRKILALEDQIAQQRAPASNSWMGEAMADLGLAPDEADFDSGATRRQKLELKAVRERLKTELFSGRSPASRYLTKDGGDQAARILAGTSHTIFVGDSASSILEYLHEHNT